jgi:hypothetical protein
MTPLHNLQVEVQQTEDHSGWAVIVGGRQAVVVATESTAVQIAEELAGWLRRGTRTSKA